MVSKHVFLAYGSVRANQTQDCSYVPQDVPTQSEMRIQKRPQINILASCPNKLYYHFET